jgi:hypothetical protein
VSRIDSRISLNWENVSWPFYAVSVCAVGLVTACDNKQTDYLLSRAEATLISLISGGSHGRCAHPGTVGCRCSPHRR